MSLSCNCDSYYDPEIHTYAIMDYFETTLSTSRRKRCCSCGSLIDLGSMVTQFNRARQPIEDTIEYSIHGCPDEPCIELAPWFECEECSDMRENLQELGYCIPLGENIMDALKEYREMANTSNHKIHKEQRKELDEKI